ncbi:MAG: ribbon-helix-helix protein, CopG family [Pseudomonadota bacterium]
MASKQRLDCVGIALAPDVIKELDAMAARASISRSEVIRMAVGIGMPLMQAGFAISPERILTILEHTQLALTLLIERECPERATELIRLARARVEEHHG